MRLPSESRRRVTAMGRVTLALGLALLATQARPADVDVVVHEGQIDVLARAAPLSQVLDQIAAAIGTEVEYEGPPPQQVVTLDLVDQSPAEVFVNVLGDQGVDFALKTDAEGTSVVRLFIAADSTAPDPVHLPPPTDPAPAPPVPEVLQTLLDQMRAEAEPPDELLDDLELEGDETDEGEPEPPALPEALQRLLNPPDGDSEPPGDDGTRDDR